jgi:Zinc-binding dehydrogenase
VARIKELTGGLGVHSVVEAVGTQASMLQAIRATRPGRHVGYVGVAHGVELPGTELFFSHVHLHGGPAPVRRFLPELIDRMWNRRIDPGKVFDLTLPLEQAAEGYRAMDERRAIKTLLRPWTSDWVGRPGKCRDWSVSVRAQGPVRVGVRFPFRTHPRGLVPSGSLAEFVDVGPSRGLGRRPPMDAASLLDLPTGSEPAHPVWLRARSRAPAGLVNCLARGRGGIQAAG